MLAVEDVGTVEKPRSRGSKALPEDPMDPESKLTEAGRFLRNTAQESIDQALGHLAARRVNVSVSASL